MAIAIDTSVLLDVLLDDPANADRSKAALREASERDFLIIGEAALAELVPAAKADSIVDFLSDWRIQFVPSTIESALLAGRMYRTFLDRGGKRGRVVPDFLIGAHAQIRASALVARDRGYFRDYFSGLRIIEP